MGYAPELASPAAAPAVGSVDGPADGPVVGSVEGPTEGAVVRPAAILHLDAVRALAALAHDARLAVFKLLVQAGPEGLPAGVLAEQLAVAPSALSFHLKELTHAGLLVQRPEGRKVMYSANFSTMNGLMAHLTDNCCQGAPCAVTPVAAPCCAA